jgi:endoglucanase
MGQVWLAVLGILSISCGARTPKVGDPNGGVPPALVSKLQNCVNILHWFCSFDPKEKDHFDTYLNKIDFAAFKTFGFTSVRLCVSPEAIFDHGTPVPDTLKHLDKAIDRLERANLAVIVDLHSEKMSVGIEGPGADTGPFKNFWKSMAEHYRGQREDSMIFELKNEPAFENDPDDWYVLQEETVKVVRAVDPKRTIIVNGTSWDSLEQMLKMTPLAESNLIYTFHFYEPYLFTHQGAYWLGDPMKSMTGIPFPLRPDDLSLIIGQEPDQVKGATKNLAAKNMDEKWMRDKLTEASEWGKHNNVPVFVGEFGCFPTVAPPLSRSLWFRTMRSILTDLQMPHALWAYDDGFGLGRKEGPGNTIQLDVMTAKNFYDVDLDGPLYYIK